MRRFVVFTLMLVMLMLCGCGTSDTAYSDTAYKEETSRRMSIVRIPNLSGAGFYVIRDNETGVCYLRGPQGGICVIVNADGTPYIDKDWSK